MAKLQAPQRVIQDQPLFGQMVAADYTVGDVREIEQEGSIALCVTGKTLKGVVSLQSMPGYFDRDKSAMKSELDIQTGFKQKHLEWWSDLTSANKSTYSRISRYASHEGVKQLALGGYPRRNFYYSGFDLFCRVAKCLDINPIPVTFGQGITIVSEEFQGEGTEFTSKQWAPYENRPCTSTYTKLYKYTVDTVGQGVFIQLQHDVSPILGSMWVDVYEYDSSDNFLRCYRPVVKVLQRYGSFVQHVKQTFFFARGDRRLVIRLKPYLSEGVQYWDFGELLSYKIGN